MIQHNVSRIAGHILIGIALYLLAGIIIAGSGLTEEKIVKLVFLPGEFLFSAYLWGALFLPLYIAGCAWLLYTDLFYADVLFVLSTAVIPFFTVSLMFRILAGYTAYGITEQFVNTFGKESGAILLFLLAIVEVLIIYRVKMLLFPAEAESEQKGSSAEQADDEYVFEKQSAGYAQAASDTENAAAEDTETEAAADTESAFYEDTEAAPYAESKGLLRLSGESLSLTDNSAHSDNTGKDKDKGSGGHSRYDKILGHFPDIPDAPVLHSFQHHKKEQIPAEDTDLYDVSKEPEAQNHQPHIEENEFEDEPTEEPSAEEYSTKVPSAAVSSGTDTPDRRNGVYSVPVDGILNDYDSGDCWYVDNETKEKAEVLRQTLAEFKIEAEVTGIRKGPVVTMYEILPAPGVKLSKIVNLADNLALRLAASSVRIVAPIPGKHAVGIEAPNKERAIVSFREMITGNTQVKRKQQIPIALGKDIAGEAKTIDLVQTPHLLIAGATGSGKSVCVNSIICSILYQKPPNEVRLILIDPKIVELKFYNDIPHLLTPVITDPKRAFQALQYCLDEMERRYSLLDSLGVRDIQSFNRKVEENNLAVEKIPYLVVVVDEFADLMATSGKELEATLARLAAMSRAVGIHLVLATQRPSIDVITGLIKANIPSRIAFMVASKFDSRIIIDSVGAEKLLGKGDMLFVSAWDPFPERIQGAFMSEKEVENVVQHVRSLGKPDYIDDEIFYDEDEDSQYEFEETEDPLMDRAVEVVMNANKASASYLQRRLKIGYNRAARLVEEMEHRGIVGPQNGSKPREILTVPDEYQQ